MMRIGKMSLIHDQYSPITLNTPNFIYAYLTHTIRLIITLTVALPSLLLSCLIFLPNSCDRNIPQTDRAE
jgi:hypothetical protein